MTTTTPDVPDAELVELTEHVNDDARDAGTGEPETAPRTPHIEQTSDAAPTRLRMRGRARVRRALGAVSAPFRPPDIWAEPRPSLLQLVRHAWYGSWTGYGEHSTVGRRLGQAYAVLVSIPAHVVGYMLLWVVERPSRLLLAAGLATLVLWSPAGPALQAPAGLLSDITGLVAGNR